MANSRDEQEAHKNEVACLERRLHSAQRDVSDTNLRSPTATFAHSPGTLPRNSSLHTLLLLADSALPLGSFAFSSGLESFLAHKKLKGTAQSQQGLFNTFLYMSLQSLASTALPYVLASYRSPEQLHDLDNDFDASIPCIVARRASVAQGRALLNVWDRSYKRNFSTREKAVVQGDISDSDPKVIDAYAALLSFSADLYLSAGLLPVNAHFAPLWGIITLLLRVDLESAAYLFLFSHARTVISAAVRASVLGPYQAQSVLVSLDLQRQIEALIKIYWMRKVEKAGQSVPVIDLWAGRHEKLYSRIFNS